ncbi:hypothetical protein L2X99_02055 [Microbacterium sp. KUDC0406]|nr:hypothetical protein [Microbacterium sp. KUDC0406]UJP10499.1 hypothetical protein L2X99_02055 [Microbacterium sp. KUDC0406]
MSNVLTSRPARTIQLSLLAGAAAVLLAGCGTITPRLRPPPTRTPRSP